MAIDRLQVQIGADIGGAVSNLQAFDKTLEKIGKTSEQAGAGMADASAGISKLSSGSSATSAAMDRVAAKIESVAAAAQESKVALVSLGNARIPLTSINAYNAAILKMKLNIASVSLAPIAASGKGIPQAAASLDKLGTTAKKTGINTLELSRVIQDLPFGFAGIANNLTQLIPGIGAAGLAFSALVTAVTFAQIGFGAWTRGIGSNKDAVGEHVKAIQEARKALDDYVQSLDDINRVRVVGAQNAQEELVQLKTLYDATQNANIPLATRKKLVDELQDQYPQTFANFKDEVILVGGAKAAYDKLTTSILQTARARAGQDALVDVQKQLLANEAATAGAVQDQGDVYKQIIALKRSGQKLTETSLSGEERLTSAGAKMNKLQQEYNEKNSATNKLLADRTGLLKSADRLSADITATVTATPEVLLDPTAKLDKEKAVKKVKKKIEDDLIKPISQIPFDPPDVFFAKQPEVKLEFQANKDFAKLVQAKFEAIQIKPRVDIVPQSDIKPLDADKLLADMRAEELSAELGKNINALLATSITSGFAGLGESIGEAIASGANPIEAAGKSILGAVGDFVSQMGKALIQYGVQKAILDKILAGGIIVPGGAAIAAGVAMVALGAILKSALKPKKFAQGGFVPGQGSGDTVPALLTPGEYVVPKKKVKEYFSVIKLMESTRGAAMPRNINGSFGFASGGFVPSVRSVTRIGSQGKTKNLPAMQPQVILVGQRLRGRDAVLQQARETKSQRRGF